MTNDTHDTTPRLDQLSYDAETAIKNEKLRRLLPVPTPAPEPSRPEPVDLSQFEGMDFDEYRCEADILGDNGLTLYIQFPALIADLQATRAELGERWGYWQKQGADCLNSTRPMLKLWTKPAPS